MYEYANIKAYKPDHRGTHLQIFIPDQHLEQAIVKKKSGIAWCGWMMEDI